MRVEQFGRAKSRGERRVWTRGRPALISVGLGSLFILTTSKAGAISLDEAEIAEAGALTAAIGVVRYAADCEKETTATGKFCWDATRDKAADHLKDEVKDEVIDAGLRSVAAAGRGTRLGTLSRAASFGAKKALPVAGQLATAWEVGWTIGKWVSGEILMPRQKAYYEKKQVAEERKALRVTALLSRNRELAQEYSKMLLDGRQEDADELLDRALAGRLPPERVPSDVEESVNPMVGRLEDRGRWPEERKVGENLAEDEGESESMEGRKAALIALVMDDINDRAIERSEMAEARRWGSSLAVHDASEKLVVREDVDHDKFCVHRTLSGRCYVPSPTELQTRVNLQGAREARARERRGSKSGSDPKLGQQPADRTTRHAPAACRQFIDDEVLTQKVVSVQKQVCSDLLERHESYFDRAQDTARGNCDLYNLAISNYVSIISADKICTKRIATAGVLTDAEYACFSASTDANIEAVEVSMRQTREGMGSMGCSEENVVDVTTL